jgi:hypothetical protein
MLRDKAVIKVNEATLASAGTGASPGK